MRGAQALLGALVASGVEVCFANPGTSEMHFVASLDAFPEMRGVLGLFEGVCTGAADGYGRMADQPAITLLHLGPGLANGLANLHNARRAGAPVVNIVGDHATYHKQYDAPLESDIESLARPMSGWYRSSARPDEVAADAVAAVEAACGPPRRVATLVLPADVSWLDTDDAAAARVASQAGARRAGLASPPQGDEVPSEVVEAIARVLASGEPTAVLLGGRSLRERGLLAASRVAVTTGARLFSETFPGRTERGAGLPVVERLAYFGELAAMQLDGLRHLVLVDARVPVSPFAYPGLNSELLPAGCETHVLTGGADDVLGALEALADAVGARLDAASVRDAERPARPSGPLTAGSVAAVVGSLLPEGAIVSDEAITAGLFLFGATEGAPPHDWLSLSGNAIGEGLPCAIGAAVACPDRPVIALQADGSAMYTIQALWTQAREGLDITTILLDNASYAILNYELKRVGAEAGGAISRSLLDLSNPSLDFAKLAESMGVGAARAETCEELATAIERALGEPGPHLVHAVLARDSRF
jgi:acetolactate synthase I/II/III large subunit